jgi:protein O-GlcNAc transferase
VTLRLLPPQTTDPLLAALREGLARHLAEEQSAALQREAVLARRVREVPQDSAARIELAQCRMAAGDEPGALEVLLEGTRRVPAPQGFELWWHALWRLHAGAKFEHARELAHEAIAAFPGRLEFQLAERLLLPLVYDSEAHLEQCRAAFASGLDWVHREVPLASAAEVARAHAALAKWTNFYLGYQGRDDRELNRSWGTWVRKVMTLALGDSPPQAHARARRRVGFVSQHFEQHSVGLCMLGFIEHLDRARFETCAYHLGSGDDNITRRVRASTDAFLHSQDVAAVRRSIIAREFDVLVYLDVGMSAFCAQLAALRLAPVQCATWGHSVTTGLPTVDHFISSEWMEQPGSEAHYTENLVKLPQLGFSAAHERMNRALFGFTRAQFGLPGDAPVFLCPHSLFKYPPAQDAVFARIARRVPHARILFVSGESPAAAERFQRRLGAAFTDEGLRPGDHCVFLPRVGALEFSQLYVLADVYLDAMGWSGCNTTIEALDRALPVVTCAGAFQRGRQSAALLRAAGVPELVAHDADGYVECAVRLATDRAHRSAISTRLADATARGRLRTLDYLPAFEAFLSGC